MQTFYPNVAHGHSSVRLTSLIFGYSLFYVYNNKHTSYLQINSRIVICVTNIFFFLFTIRPHKTDFFFVICAYQTEDCEWWLDLQCQNFSIYFIAWEQAAHTHSSQQSISMVSASALRPAWTPRPLHYKEKQMQRPTHTHTQTHHSHTHAVRLVQRSLTPTHI